MHAQTHLYKEDFHAWIHHQVDLLRQGRVQDIDSLLVAEELEAMGCRERNELVSRLIVLLAHLLKWQHRPRHRSSKSIMEQRVQVGQELRLSPSLGPFLPAAIQEAYPYALRIAAKETGLDTATFPALCPYQEGEILDEDFWPDRS